MAKTVTITFHHQLFELNGDGTLYWPEQSLLIVSDLHLEKGAALSEGAPLPHYDTLDTLQRLQRRLQACQPMSVLFLGDSFHTIERAYRMPAPHLDFLQELSALSDFIWVTGNHDSHLPDRLPGTVHDTLEIENMLFCHEAEQPSHRATISGHYHPKARVKLRARRLSARCFLQTTNDIILPAFGSYTGGLNICDAPLVQFLNDETSIHLIHDGNSYSVPYQKHLFKKHY